MKTVFYCFLLESCIVLFSLSANAECTKDVECKGERICEKGKCVYPKPPNDNEASPDAPVAPEDEEEPAEEPTEDNAEKKEESPPPPESAPPTTVDNAQAEGDTEPAVPKTVEPAPEPVAPEPAAPEPAALETESPAPIQAEAGPAEDEGVEKQRDQDRPAAPPVVASTPSPSPSPSPSPIPVSENTDAAEPLSPAPQSNTLQYAAKPASRVALFEKFYFDLDFGIGTGAFGRITKTDDAGEDDSSESHRSTEGVLPGFRAAGYLALIKYLHIGAHFMFSAGKGVDYSDEEKDKDDEHLHIGTGLDFKSGVSLGRRVWFGGGVGVGFYMERHKWSAESKEYFLGVHLLPRFCVDVYIVKSGEFKMSVPIGLGVNVVPFSTLTGDTSDAEVKAVDISPVALVGIAVGM